MLEGADIFAADFINQEICNAEIRQMSPIQKFFVESTVFVTGGTGFLGKILIDKLIRSCSGVKLICVLVRSKAGRAPDQRLDDILDPRLGHTLHQSQPNFLTKIRIIPGDCTLPNLGVSEENLRFLKKETEVVFNMASVCNLNEHIKLATQVNVLGTKSLLEIAKDMRRLKSFIHVSSTFANCNQVEVQEKFYDSPLLPEKLINLVDILDNATLESITPQIIGNWPNTFSYTKNLAENVIKTHGVGLPIAIIRPSLVLSIAEEPLAGWIDNVYGLQGLLYSIGLGMLQTVHCKPRLVCDVVPADFLINAVISLAWEIGVTRGDAPNIEKVDQQIVEKPAKSCDIPICHYASGFKNPLTWGNFYDFVSEETARNPTIRSFWISDITINANNLLHNLFKLLFHLLPSVFIDLFLYFIGRQPFFLETYRKIHRFEKEFSYFAQHRWYFQDTYSDELFSRLSGKDKAVFNFNLSEIVWENYLGTCVRGIRIFLLNDSLITIQEAKLKRKRLLLLRFILRFITISLLCYLIFSLKLSTYFN